MWSKVISTPSKTFRAVGESKTKKLNENRKRKSTDSVKIKGIKQRGRANQHHNKAENTIHGMTGAAMQMMFSLTLLTITFVNL